MKLNTLYDLIGNSYNQKHSNRDKWCDWLYEHHVLWVANRTEELCKKYGGRLEIAVAAALVHDIADTLTSRSDPEHKEKSLELGRELCTQAGYTPDEIAVIIDDIGQLHSCRNGKHPASLEGKIMATADACSHYETDFYLHAFAQGSAFRDYDWQREWMYQKLKKDLENKIFFDEERARIQPLYEVLRQITLIKN